MIDIDREGIGRGRIVEYGLREYDSGAIAIGIKVEIDEWLDGDTKEWEVWRGVDDGPVVAYGNVFLTKKDGTINTNAVQSLKRCCGWDGDLMTVSDGTWQPEPCQVVIKANEYNGDVTYQVAFLNAYDRVPGMQGSVDTDRAKQLAAALNAKLRAIGGVAKQQPPKSEPKLGVSAPQQRAAAKAQPDDEIPF